MPKIGTENLTGLLEYMRAGHKYHDLVTVINLYSELNFAKLILEYITMYPENENINITQYSGAVLTVIQ